MQFTGKGFLALWNDTLPKKDNDYNEWHTTEHVPERLTVPGMLSAKRYRTCESVEFPYFTFYEMNFLSVLESVEYKQLLINPTPWSQEMRRYFSHMLRIPCVMEKSFSHSKEDRCDLVVASFDIQNTAFMDTVFDEVMRIDGVSGFHFCAENSTVDSLSWFEENKPVRSIKGVFLVELKGLIAEGVKRQVEALLKRVTNNLEIRNYEFLNEFHKK